MTFVPKHVLIAPYYVMSWLYKPLIPALRQRYGTRFTLVLPEGTDVLDNYKHLLEDADRVRETPNYVEMARRRYAIARDDHQLVEEARAFEQRYKALIWRDIVQQERDQAWLMIAGAWRMSPFARKPLSMIEHYSATLGYVDLFEDLFDRDPIDLAFLWPRSGGEAVGALIAEERGVPVTYPYTGKHKNIVYWAQGAFGEADQHFRALEEVPALSKNTSVDNEGPPGRPAELDHAKLSARYGFMGTVKKSLITSLHALEHAVIDIRKGQFGNANRAPLGKTLVKNFSDWAFYRRFDELCEKDFVRLTCQPFVFYAFQNEPEFSVQARSKEFSDQGFVIRQLAKSLPAGVQLVIKEHAWIGERSLEYYKELLAFPNIVMAHPSIRALDLIPHSLGVASLSGTVTLEAAVMGRRAVIFSGRSEFARMPSVRLVDRLDRFDHAAAWLTDEVDDSERHSYRQAGLSMQAAIENIGVDAPQLYTKEGFEVEWPHLDRAISLLIENIEFQQSLGKDLATSVQQLEAQS